MDLPYLRRPNSRARFLHRDRARTAASKRPHPIERVQADALLRRDLPGVRPDRPSSPHRGCLWEPTNALRRRRGLRQTACSDREGAAAPPPPARWGSERLSGHGAATGRATEKTSPSHTREPPLESSSAWVHVGGRPPCEKLVMCVRPSMSLAMLPCVSLCCPCPCPCAAWSVWFCLSRLAGGSTSIPPRRGGPKRASCDRPDDAAAPFAR